MRAHRRVSSGFCSRPARSLFVIVAAAAAAVVIFKFEQDLPDYSQLKNYEPPVMTRVHAADGSLLAEYSRERRLYLPSSAIPDLVKQRVHLGRGQEFLHPPRLRSRRHRARRGRVHGGQPAHPGRLDHHPAGRQELSAHLRPHGRAQDPRNAARACASNPPIPRTRSSSSISTRSTSASAITASPPRRSIISTSRCTS